MILPPSVVGITPLESVGWEDLRVIYDGDSVRGGEALLALKSL
jgi:hypothetical protein